MASQPSFDANGEMNFEDLVAGGSGSLPATVVNGTSSTQQSTASWEADPWDSIFKDADAGVTSPPASTTTSTFASPTSTFPSLPPIQSNPHTPSSSLRPIQPASPPPMRSTPMGPPSFPARSTPSSIPALPGPSRYVPPVQRTSSPLATSSWTPLQTQPIPAHAQPTSTTSYLANRPNYNLSLEPDPPIPSGNSPFQTPSSSFPSWNMPPATQAAPVALPSFAAAPIQFSAPPLAQSSSAILVPTKMGASGPGSGSKKTDWKDFDPLG